jgi:hypothetical protein
VAYYELVGGGNRHTDWTSEVVLERDEDGKPTKVVGVGQPAELTKEEQSQVSDLGYELRSVNKDEAERLLSRRAQQAAADTRGAAPLLGDEHDDSAQEGDNDNQS